MNKIFKVIWSKSKQCYIVVSEIAKNKTGKKKIVVASILAALAMQSGLITEVMAADPPSARLADASQATGTNGLAIGSAAKSMSNQSVAIGYFSVASAPASSPENPATAVGAGANAIGAGTSAYGLSAYATADYATAIGKSANAKATNTIAIGKESYSETTGSLALGLGAKNTGTSDFGATAIGPRANTAKGGSIAVGIDATATGLQSIAIGSGSATPNASQKTQYPQATSKYSIAIGTNSNSQADYSIALGFQTLANAQGASALGPASTASGKQSTAVGYKATSTKDNDNAFGSNVTANGGRATAIGDNSQAGNERATAIGADATASGLDSFAGASGTASGAASVAIGKVSKATDSSATAVGDGTSATGQGATALGSNATAKTGFDLAVGRAVTSDGGAATVVGYNSNVKGNQSTGMGSGINITSQKATGIGYQVNVSGDNAIGIGSSGDSTFVTASGASSIAMGTSAVANQEKAIAIGANSKGTNIGATALGRSSEATGASATALGSLASATGSTATAVGMEASATGNESLAIGKKASATSGRALAVGTNTTATGASSVAVGSGAGGSGIIGFAGSLNSTAGVVNTNRTINYATTADGDNAVALGFYANAKNSGVAVGQKALAATGGVAIGKGVLEDTGNNHAGGVVIGQDSASTGVYSLAMGFNAFASGSTSMAIGHTVSADGGFAVAMGRKVSATGTSTAIGHHATATNGGLAIGSQDNDTSNDRTTASATGAVAIGKNANATSEDAVAIGTNAQATLQGAVALGSGSTTATGATNQGSTKINGITYNFAGATGNPNMQVSVGSAGATRQIKNVAAGEVSATSTDAINGSQLYAVASAVKPLKYVSVNSAAAGTGSNVDNDGAQGGNSIAIGPSSTVTRQNGIAIGSGAQSLSEDSVVIGRDAKAETKTGAGLTTTSRAIVIGSNSRVAADVTQGVAIGSGLSPDEGAVVTGDQSIAIGGNVKVDGHSAIAIGGDDARKAANQLVSYTNTDDTEVTGTLQTAIQNLTGYNLSNYKGTTASHAGVAYGTSALAGNAGVAIGTAADSMTRMNDKGQVVNNKPVTNAVAIGTAARANFDNSVAIGGGSNTDHYATKQVNAIIDGVEVKWSGGENISPGDVVSFGAKGFERQLKNVAPGEVSQTSTDAVNGSQIYSLARKVTNIMNGGSGSVVNVNATGEPLSKVVTGTGASKVERYYRTVDVEDDGTLKNGAIAQTPTSLALVNIDQTDTNKQTQTPRILGNVANGVKDNDAVNVSQLNAAKVKYFSVNSTDAGNINNDGATGTDAIAIGPSAVSNAVGSVALGKDAKANGDFTVALGGGNWQFKGAQANGVGTTALGSSTKTKVGTNYQTAIGFGATTEAESALAVGYNAAASAQNAIALGRSASTAGQDAVALGSSSQAKGDSGLAIGNGAQANSNSVISLGYQANNGASNNTNGVAIGWAAGMQSNGLNNVGVGTNAGRQVIGNNNTSLGNGAGNIANTKIYTSESIMLGTGAKVVGSSAIKSIDNVIAIGKNTSGSASSAIAVGINAGSSAENGVAIGPNSNTSAYNGIALGSFSEASTAAGVPGYNVNANRTDKYAGLTDIALTSKLGAVSVGNSTMTRQITGVAAGTNDTDAVNIAQLKSVNLAFTGNTGSGDVNLANSKLSINGDNTYIKTAANGKQLTISPNVQNITLNNGRASASTGLADASNVAQAINNVVSGVQLDIVANKGTKTGSVNLSNQKLTVTGGNGIRTDIYANTGGQNLVIGLEPELVNATTKGIGLTGDTGSTGLKYLKDGDATFKVAGDGNLVTTVGSAAGVKVSVDSTKVKDLAVEAVSVSKANTVDNPITVTPKAGTNSKEYAIGIDTTKLAAKTHLAYTANGGTAKTVSLAKGLNFVNGTNTVATVDSDGKVSFDINKDTKDSINKSATAVGRTITLNADSGTGSSQSLSNGNVSFAVSGATGDYISTTMDGSAVKVSTKRATINSDANTGAASVTGADGLATAKNVASAINSAVNGLSQNLNISDGTKDSSVALKNQKLTVTGTGAVKATVNGQTITIDVAKGTLTANADGTATGTAGVADASDVASAINNTNTVLGNKITKNTQDIATNTSNITANKNQITTNTTNIATNTTNIAHTIALADDNGTSTTAKSLKDGNVSFNIKGDNKFISTAASGNDVTLTVNEQAIKDAAKNASSFKVKANATAAEDVKGGDTIAFNNGDNIEISQTGKTFTIGTAKNITVDSVTAGNTVINTSGLTNGTTAITGTGVTTDKVTVGGLSIDKTAGINAGGKVISNVASGGTTDSNAANIGDVKQAVANLSQNLNITDGTNNGTVDLKNQKLNVAGANGVTATVNNQTITVGLDANTVNATTKGIGLTGDTGSTGNKYLKDGDVSFAVTGDGNLVSTSATAAGVKVAVDAAKVKDLAVAAVTVSKDTQADNPITVTPTAGTNSKDYAIGIDTTKLAAKTDLTYRANSAADANAKKVSLSKGLNFVDGDSTVATVDNDGKVSFDLNTATKNQINTNTTDIATNKGKIATNTTNIAANTTALARHISLDADTGTSSSQSLSAADVAFNVKGATGDFVSTNMNGNTVEISTKRATINSNATTGEASVTGNDGLATAQNVADAINKAADAAKAGAAWNITTNSSTTDKTAVKGGDTVDLVNGDNIEITQDGTDKKKITVATKKDITVDSVTANNKVTVGSGANKITLDGTDGSVTGKAFTGTTFTGTSFTGTSFTAGNTVINTNGLTNGTTAITGTGVTTDNVTVGGISIDKTAGINAGNKVISNVASGGTTLTNAANIGDVQNAVANLSQNLNITDGTHDGTVNLKNQKLNVAGANGVTATVNNQTITVGLDANTVNATTKGIGLTADTGSTGNKYLKDGDVSFAVTGDGSLVSTSATAAGVKVAVDAAKVKDLAVDAVTVSKDAQADNPITVTPTAGTNSKDYAIGIDTTKLAGKTDLTYRANNDIDANAKKVSLAKGLNFVNGTLTTASIDNDGVVKYDVNTAAITAGTDGTVTGPTTDGVATAQNVADAINAAKKASKTEITANTGEAANATTGNVTLTSTTAADGHTIYDLKLNDKVTLGTGANAVTIDGTAGKATIGSSVIDGVNNTITTGGASPVTLDGATGTITGKTANIGGVTVNGTTNDITGLSNTTVTGADFATKGRAATEEQLKAVTSATALKFTGDVATNTGSINLKDDTFGIKGDGKYITTDVNGKDVNLTVSEAEVKKSAVAAVTVSTDTTDANNPISVTPTTSADGTTKDYKVTIDGTKIANKTNLSYKANDGTAKQVSLADGLNFKNGTLTTASINDAGVVKYDVNTAAITAGTDGTVTGPTTDGVATAQNVADAINAAKKASKTEITANTGEAANATTGNVTLTSTAAADGHTIYDVKLNDKVTLGTGANAVTIDGTAGKITAKNAAIGGVTVDGDNSHVTGLSNTTWNGTATTGRAATEDQLKAVADTAKATTDAVNLKFSGDTNTSAGVVNLKDDTFNIVGDGKYVTTDANGKDLTVKVSEAEVKKSAVAAVTVSTDTTDANNPISVTPTTSADGTTKDYKVTIDGTKIANKTNLSYKANDGTAKQVSLADGLNFKNGTLTTASIDDAGVVKYDVNTATITAGTDGTVTGPTTDGVATAQNVADAINAAKKAAKTEITANTGEAANATTGNVTLTSTAAADGHTIYDVKLNDKVILGTGANAVTIDGTAGKATIGSSVVDGVNNTITTGGANAVSLDGAAGKATIGSSVVDGVNNTITTGGANAVSLDGAAGTVTGLTNKDWTPGVTKAVTGRAATEDQLQKVADAASSQTWNITADKAGTTGAQTGTKKNATVGKDQTVELVAGDNLIINQDERKFTYYLNKDLAGLTSVSVGDGTTETINLDGATGKITAKNAVIGGVTVDGDNSHVTGLSNTTWNGTATTGRAATEDQLKVVADTAKATTDAVNLKFSGDTNTSAGVVNLKDDTFNIVGDGKYVTTDANGKDLTVKVSEAEVKKSAVAAVTVSTDTTDANNPISVTPTTSADGTTKDYKVTIDGTKIANKTNLSYKANDGAAKLVSLADGLNFKNGTLTTASIDDAGVVKYDVNTAAITAGTDGTVTGPTTDGVATAQNVADAINAAKKAAKTEITANTGEAANATTGNVTLTSTTAADGHTIYDVKLNDKVTLGTGANAVTIDSTAGKATIGSSVVDGVNNTITTGGANAVTMDGAAGTVKTGTVTVTGGTTNYITGLSNTTVNSADFATKGRAATEEQLKAVGEQTWQITADKDATTSGAQTGTKKDAKVGKDDKVQLIAGENLTVNQNERDFTYSLNKDLVKMNSATFEATGGKTTVITGDSIAQTDGTKTNRSTAAGNTVADGGKSTATTADGVRINTTAKNPVSLTDAGLDNGNNVIKNVASGHVNNDDTDNTNAANIADVKKATTTVTANNGETANTTTGNVTLTSTTAADGHIIYDVKLNDKVTLGTGSNAVTIDGTAGKATIGSSVVDGVNNTITTGGANAVTMDGAAGTVKTGTVTVAGGTTNDITGLSNTTVNSADFATKGRAATEEQLKAVGEQTWQITADKDATTSGAQTGTKKDAKVGKDDKVQLIAGENLTVNQNERDFTYSLNKDLVKMNSATFEATGGKTTVITGDSIAQTDGTKTNTSTAAGNTVADGTKSTETTAAGQVIKDGAKSNKSTVDSNVIDDGNGNVNTSNATSNTIANGADSTATTAAGTTVTTANGNTNYTADGVRINTTGKNPVSLTDAGLDNGNNVIKNVASGHVNNDDTDNTNAANIADVKKATTTVTANNGEAANATTGNVTLTSTTAADGHTIYDVKLNDKVTLGTGANAVTIDGTAGKATVGTAVVDGVNNTITTGGANAVKLDGAAGTVKTGTVTVTGGTTNDITGLSNTTVNSADFATKGRAATEEQLKAVGEQTWQITADKDATTSGAQTGTKKDAKVGKDDKVQLIAGENLTVNQNERDFTYSLNKDLVKMNSATFEATGSKTTIITGDRIAQTDGTKTNTSTAAGNTVVDGTKSTETTAAGQVIKDGAKTNTSTVDENTLVDGAKSNKTTVDSNVIDDGNGNINTANATSNTIANGADSTATTAAGTTVTTANGNTNYTADGVRINTTGKNPVSLTDAGLDNGNNVIKNVASGHVNNDDTDNTNAANIADVKKATTTVTANNGEAANATTGNVTLTSTTAADGHTIYDVKLNDKVTLGTGANAVTIDGTAGKATVGTAVVDGVNNTITTGGANAVKLDGAAGTVKTGTVTVTGGTTNDITGLSNTTVNSADFATKGRAATEEQLKAVGEQTWQITADKDATTSGAQTGTKKDAKVGKDDKVQLIAGENLTVNQNERDFTYSLNKDLVKMNSATFEATGSKTTIITGDRIAQTDGTKTNTSTAAGNTVVDGTKSTETTAAGQVIKDGAKTNTSTVDENTLVDGAKSNKTTVDSNVIDDSNGNVNTSNATSNTITDGTNTSTVTAGKAQIGTVGIDGVASKITTGGANAVVINGADGTVKTGTVTLTGGTTNDITGLSNTTVNSADFATKGRAATEEQLKAVGEQTWQITADKDATTSGAQTGTKKDAKVGKDDKVQLIAGENLTVNQNERDFTYSLNKDLVKMNSATFEATGGKTTVITGDSIAQTDGAKTNTSTAAGNTVADGTKSTETTAAGQVIKDGAKTNTSTVDENTLVDGAKSNKTTVDSNVIDDGNGNVNTAKATSNTITDGTNTTEATASTVTVKDNAGNSTVITKDTITTGTGANKVTVDGTAGKVTAGSAVIDGVNNTITTGGANAVKLDGAAGTVTGLTNTAWTPGVTKAVSGRAATEDQLQQVSDAVGAGWNINSGTVTGSTGEANGSTKTKISSGEEVQLQAGNNLIIDQHGKTLAYSLNKNLKDMESAIFNATGGKTTVIKGDSIVQTDGGKTNTSNAAGNTVVDGTKSTATTAAGTTITDGAKTNTNTADKNVIDDGAGNTNTSNATSNTIADSNGNTNTATATSNTLADNAGNSNVSNATSNNLTDNAGNSNVSNATSNTLKNAAGDETKVDAKGATVKDAAGNTTNIASTGATVTNAAGDTTKVEATGTTVADAAGNKATFTKDGVTIIKPGKDTVSLTGNGLDNGNNKIVNVADGTNDTDAVNVRQLDAKTKAARTELTANGGESADNTTGNIVLTKTTAPDGHIIYDNKLNDKIILGAADPTKAVTVDGTNGTIKAGKDGNAVAINGTDGTIKAGDGTNAVAIDGVNGSVKVADKIALNGKDGKATIGTVGIDGKDGIITTGGNNPVAVNGKDGVVTGLTNKTWDPNNITSGRAATEDQVQSAVANAGWDATVGTEGSGVNSTPSATPEKIRPNETLTFKAGNNMMVSQNGKIISYAVNPELTDMKSATFKDAAGNTTVTNGNGMTITPGSANPNNPNAGPVSLTKDGLNNGNNQIKGVTPGTDPTDVVNVSQLNASNANTSQAINQIAGEVQRVGAHAAAMAALKPIQYDPLEPTQVMAGVGNYRGETAAALGLAHYTNENTMFNVGVSVGGNHNMVNAGVTHKFGYSPEKKNIPDRYKAGPISSVYVMQDEVSSLKKENAEQKYVIADQAARLNTLEAENERQRQELAETKQGLDDLRAAVDKLLASKG